jgi:hypothetical protein
MASGTQSSSKSHSSMDEKDKRTTISGDGSHASTSVHLDISSSVCNECAKEVFFLSTSDIFFLKGIESA